MTVPSRVIYQIDPTSTKTSTTNKRWSLKARIKALISEEISKEERYKQRGSRLQRTYSIHHLEPSDHAPHGKSTVWGRPVIFLHRKAKRDTKKPVDCNEKLDAGGSENVSVNQKHMEADQPCTTAAHCHSKEHADVLEIFRVNKDLFLKVQKDKEGLANCFADLQASNPQARLTKSGSFPTADLSRLRNFRPSTIKHKQNEVWSFPKGEKSFTRTQAPNRTTTYHEVDGSVNDLSTVRPTRSRRTSSRSVSLESYAQLFQNSFSREANLHHSKSLKVINEYEIPSGGHGPLSFKRLHSLPSDSQFSGIPIRTVADSSKNVENNSHDEQKPLDLPLSTEKYVSLELNSETECVYDIVETSDGILRREHLASSSESINEHATAEMLGLGDEMDEQRVGESNLDKEQDITSAEIASSKIPLQRPVSVLRSCSQVDENNTDDFPNSEGLECRSSYVDEKESTVDSQYQSCSISNPENFEIANKDVKNQRHIEFCENDNADFNYVSLILEVSGFDGSSFLGPWHSMDQPLNPLVFEEVEACWPHEPHYSEDQIFAHHQLLFDLINEVLLQIYDSSFTYYPKELSSNCRIRPMPVRSHFLEEFWLRISRTLSLSQQVDQSVECIVAQDLGKDDGWMNLQLESECVALELEDLIFDELLEEIICS